MDTDILTVTMATELLLLCAIIIKGELKRKARGGTGTG